MSDVIEEPRESIDGCLAEFTLALQMATTFEHIGMSTLKTLQGVVAADAFGLTVWPSASGKMNGGAVATYGAPAGLVQDYSDMGYESDPVLARAFSEGWPSDNGAIPYPTWETCAAHAILRQYDFRQTMVVPLVSGTRHYGVLHLARRDEKTFSRSDHMAMRTVQDHLTAAVLRFELLASVEKRGQLFESLLDSLEDAAISTIFDEVLHENETARRLFVVYPDLRSAVTSTQLEHARDLYTNGKRIVQSVVPLPSRHRNAVKDCLIVRSQRLPDTSPGVFSILYVRRLAQHCSSRSLPISEREREIAELVAQGLTNRQIAERTYISENTVRQHLKRTFVKLGVHSRAELTNAVLRASFDGDE